MERPADQGERALGLAALKWTFPQHTDRLSQLFETTPQFRQLCGDYGVALMAGKVPSEKPDVLRQFHLITAEIELEISEILQG